MQGPRVDPGAPFIVDIAGHQSYTEAVNERSLGAAQQSHCQTTRQTILNSAYRLILNQGYHGTSMRQVARDAGLTPAAIYNHFDSKEALFVSLLSQNLPHSRMVQALEGVRGGDLETLVHEGLRRMAEALADQFDNLRLIFIEMLEFQGRHVPALAEQLMPGFMEFFHRLLAADGRLRPLPPLMIGRAYLGLFISYAITVAFFGNVPGLEATPSDLHDLGEIFLHGVLSGQSVESSSTPSA